MAYCELTGGPKGYDGQTVQAGAQLAVLEVRSTIGTIIWKQKRTYTLKNDGTWWPALRIEQGATAWIYMNAPGFDGDSQRGTPMAIPETDTAQLATISAAVSVPSQVPIAIPPSHSGSFLKLE